MTPARSFLYFMLAVQTLGAFLNLARFILATFKPAEAKYTRKDFHYLLSYLGLSAWAVWGLIS